MLPGVDLILALSEKYSAICMNPPYMTSKHMDFTLKKYVFFFFSFLIVIFVPLAKAVLYFFVNFLFNAYPTKYP